MRSRLRATLILIAIAFSIAAVHGAAQNVSTPLATSEGSFRIAGTVVSKVDGHPLANAEVALASTKARQQPILVLTSDDGKFEFTGIPEGKYSLNGAKRGFIPAGYDQHEQFSTAIVTGADLDTEHLVLKLDPYALITGRVLDEVGEPIREAMVTVYRENHLDGVRQIQINRGAQTNDLGEFEIIDLAPGTYFLSAAAQPWYAVHPPSDIGHSAGFDPSLDVSYPMTYYGDVTDAESATAISVHGGEHLQLDVHVSPVPSVHVIVHVPSTGDNQFPFPQFEQRGFDDSVPVQRFENRLIKPGTWEISGIPAGKYDFRLTGHQGVGTQISGVELNGTTQELDASTAEPMCSLKVSVSFEDVAPSGKSGNYGVTLLGRSSRTMPTRNLDSKGEAEFQNLVPGRYEIFVFGAGRRFSVARIIGEGATVSGHAVILAAGASASLSVSAVKGTAEIQGVVKRSGKPFAGAFVVLVPGDPDGKRDLFRRDQSDLDGTFVFHDVAPGAYTAVAIENGWDLDWAQPELILPYAKRGVPIQVADKPAQHLSLSGPLEVQQK
jgi:Carboxypeptidase regulatory-like domain